MNNAARRLREQKAYSTDPAYLERLAREEETRGIHPSNDATSEERMIGIVLVTHGNLARDFVAALEHVVGPQPRVVAVCIGADDDMEKRRAEILESAKACDTGDGVVVLTDMFGGTPSNLGISILEQARVEVLAGVNLPVLVKLASVRNRPIAEAVRVAQEAGGQYITVASRILAEEIL
jgi:mannose PTS system EIIA component